jgi:hypothetical protein
MAQRMVTCDIPIETETLQVYFAHLINTLCVLPLWRGRHQADNTGLQKKNFFFAVTSTKVDELNSICS